MTNLHSQGEGICREAEADDRGDDQSVRTVRCGSDEEGQRRIRGKDRAGGFTLLEVMIAIVIMVVAFTAIYSSQSGSILQTAKTKDYNLAGFLLQNLMVESEHLLENKVFGELKKSEEGEYKDPFAKFKWKREVLEIQFPDIGGAASSTENNQQSQDEKKDSTRLLTQAVTKYLTDSIRELKVTISWKKSGGVQTISTSTYLVDLTQKFTFTP